MAASAFTSLFAVLRLFLYTASHSQVQGSDVSTQSLTCSYRFQEFVASSTQDRHLGMWTCRA